MEKSSEGIYFSGSFGPSLGERLKLLRKARGWNQTDLAVACGVTQSQVSRWEKNLDKPSTAALVAIADLADETDRVWWLEAAGVSQYVKQAPEDTRIIPVLRDAAAAGSPRAVDEKEIAQTISLPAAWFPIGGRLYGVRVEGDSMSPILESGYIAFVDVTEQRPDKLAGRMVVARDSDGVTIKWLRKQGKLFILVPQHVSPRHEIRVIEPGSEISLVGEVVKWIGHPPAPPPPTRTTSRKKV